MSNVSNKTLRFFTLVCQLEELSDGSAMLVDLPLIVDPLESISHGYSALRFGLGVPKHKRTYDQTNVEIAHLLDRSDTCLWRLLMRHGESSRIAFARTIVERILSFECPIDKYSCDVVGGECKQIFEPIAANDGEAIQRELIHGRLMPYELACRMMWRDIHHAYRTKIATNDSIVHRYRRFMDVLRNVELFFSNTLSNKVKCERSCARKVYLPVFTSNQILRAVVDNSRPGVRWTPLVSLPICTFHKNINDSSSMDFFNIIDAMISSSTISQSNGEKRAENTHGEFCDGLLLACTVGWPDSLHAYVKLKWRQTIDLGMDLNNGLLIDAQGPIYSRASGRRTYFNAAMYNEIIWNRCSTHCSEQKQHFSRDLMYPTTMRTLSLTICSFFRPLTTGFAEFARKNCETLIFVRWRDDKTSPDGRKKIIHILNDVEPNSFYCYDK